MVTGLASDLKVGRLAAYEADDEALVIRSAVTHLSQRLRNS